MLRCLFVEDQPQAVESVVSSLSEICDHRICAFDDAESELREFAPDIIVLDLLNGGATGEPEVAGKTTYDLIWATRFCPIVVYSAEPDLLSDTHTEHPFVRFVRKGMGSDTKVKECLEEFRPHVQAVRDAEGHMRAEFSVALRDVARDAFSHYSTPEEQKKVILRSAQRRLASLMDDHSRHNEVLQAWEQYLCPPVGVDLSLGDILRRRDGSVDDPKAFYIVLTPSCDLVSSGGRQAKVSDVLVACCENITEGIKRTSLGDLSAMKKGKREDRLKAGILTQGYLDGIVPMPQLRGRIPSMAANLKRLMLIPLSHITSETSDYVRVAGIDSPFRELISWAYSQTGCRLGLPDRDTTAWCEEIIAVADQSDGTV